MRPLAIELSFDTTSDERLQRMWSRLSARYGGPKVSELGIRPHITLALFRNGDPRDATSVINRLAAKLVLFKLRLSTVNRFATTERVIFLQPESSIELTRAHEILDELLEEDRNLVDLYYQPGNWYPHCTMAAEVPDPVMELVFSVCQSPEVLGDATVMWIQLVRYRPATEIVRVSLE